MPTSWNPNSTQHPLPPRNVFVSPSQIIKQSYDIRWDLPELHNQPEHGNSQFNVLGVNIYRSDDTEYGPYHRINLYPISTTYFRDMTQIVEIHREVVPYSAVFTEEANQRKVSFCVQHQMLKPVQVSYEKPNYAQSIHDVKVWIDGNQVLPHSVVGYNKQVVLTNRSVFDPVTEKEISPVLPTSSSTIEVSYYTIRNYMPTSLGATSFYRVTTVVTDNNNVMRETPLDYCEPKTAVHTENLSYIWREALRRNNWMLEEGGERVWLYIRKRTGVACNCFARTREQVEFHGQPSSTCLKCYGTGWVGGYEGPFDIILPPDDSEKKHTQTSRGRATDQIQDVWTGAEPLITQRDFIRKHTGECYSIGAVRRPAHRGRSLNQFFSIKYLDTGDIRYNVPIHDPANLAYPETRFLTKGLPKYLVETYQGENLPFEVPIEQPNPPHAIPTGSVYPQITEKSNIPDEREVRGRTSVWDNQNK